MTLGFARLVLAGALIGASLCAAPAAANRFRDNPDHVIDRLNAPWTWPIGELERDVTRKKDGKGENSTVGTAFLVSPCYIMTAAHVVFGNDFDPIKGKDYALKFRAGVSPTSAFAGNTMANPVVAGNRHVRANDWALLRLNSCIGKRPEFGWFEAAQGFDDLENKDLVKSLHNTNELFLGYPSSNARGYLSTSLGQTIDYEPREKLLKSDATVLPGESGGPVLIIQMGMLKVLGINVEEMGGGSGATFDHYSVDHANLTLNAAVILNNSYVKNILDRDKAAFGQPNPAAERLRMDHLPQ